MPVKTPAQMTSAASTVAHAQAHPRFGGKMNPKRRALAQNVAKAPTLPSAKNGFRGSRAKATGPASPRLASPK